MNHATHRPSLGQDTLGPAAGVGAMRGDRVPVGQPVVVATPAPVRADHHVVTAPIALPTPPRRRRMPSWLAAVSYLLAALIITGGLLGAGVLLGAALSTAR